MIAVPARGTAPAPDIDIVVPVCNEQAGLARSIRRLHAFLRDGFPFSWRIVIADNASVDATWRIAGRLTRELPGVEAQRLERKGRGGALRSAWPQSTARAVACMDVDLATDLRGLLPLVAPLLSGHSDVAIGTRLAHGSRVVRGPKRELISRGYNAILHAALRTRFSDAQCGFKAVRADVLPGLLRDVRDETWFFDTELLVLAQRRGLRIHEVPVDWVDDPDSRVDILATALADLRGVGPCGRGSSSPPGVPSRRPPPETPNQGDPVSTSALPRPAQLPGSAADERKRTWRAPWPELLCLPALAAVLDLWALSANGWANEYYSAAVRSMAGSWHDFLYGSFDAGGVMGVDKPPLALWVQALSVRAFGFHSLSILVPQALRAWRRWP